MPPTPGVTHRGKVVRVLDGDTIEVSVTVTTHVRMLDCWAPEVHETKTAGEKARGIESKKHLEAICKPGSDVIVHVPFGDKSRFGDDMSMGRVLGDVYLVGWNETLAEMQVRAGHATKTKQ
jgi:endonuclease YncB( thermonuclease family)